MKILIAEDSRLQRAVLEDRLTSWGYGVVSAHDGNQAWELLSEDGAPSLAILDWMMPGMDGPDVCRRYRQAYPAKPTYLILLTVKREGKDVVEGLDAGADDYLPKPFNHDELRARLQNGIRVLGLLRDLNVRARELEAEMAERERTEEELREANTAAEAASRLTGEFLASVSDEVCTSMNAIIRMAELALPPQLTDEQRDHLETAKMSANSLLRLVDRILAQSAIETGQHQDVLPVGPGA